MKRNLSALLILAFVFSGQPSLPGKAQERRNLEPKSSYAEDKAVKDYKFEIALSNQDTIGHLIKEKLRPKGNKKKPEIRYVAVYKVVPIYVPEGDSVAYKETFKTDTLPGKYYFEDTTAKKRSWLYKLLHPRKIKK